MSVVPVVLKMFLMSACRITPALSTLPDDIPSRTEAWDVTGHNVRYAGAPLAFGPYYTTLVQGSGLATRCVLSGRHVGFGRESRRFAFQLERERQPVLGAGCGGQLAFTQIHAGGLQVETEAPRDTPALVCDVWPADGRAGDAPAGVLSLWKRGWDVVGTLETPNGPIDISSTRKLDGIATPMGEPVAYRLMRDGRLVAHVDVLNAGTVRMLPDISPSDRDWLAVAATALLMKVD